MRLSEPYKDGGKWYHDVIDPVNGEDVRPVGIELRDRRESWSECGAHGTTVWAQGCEYRIPAIPPEADPYHGITLPEPPAGYRLAKWGEEWTTREALWLDEGAWVTWDFGSSPVAWHRHRPEVCIFAIPFDQPAQQPPKSWQFRREPYVQKQPETLADVPEKVPCIAYHTGDLYVVYRVGNTVYYLKAGYVESGQSAHWPKAWKFVRYLDPPPQKPLSLEDVPDGRVIRAHGHQYWKCGQTWWRLMGSGGVFPNVSPSTQFTMTEYIAEFR